MHQWWNSFCKSEQGATMLEYALLASFIAAACAVAVAMFGQHVAGLFVVNA